MPSTVEQLSPTRVKITVEVPFADLKPDMDKAYREIARQVNIPGFRKGKVPAMVIDQRFGRGTVIQEAFNDALPRLYSAAVAENHLTPLAQPEVEVIDLQDGERIEFTAEVEVRPEFQLPDLDQVAVTVDAVEVPDDLVDEQLEALRRRFGSKETVERPAAEGDLVTIDLVARRDGEPLEDATAEDLEYTVGAGTMLEGLDEAVTGLSAGESTTFTSTLVGGPLKDEQADVEVLVSKVQTQELPELDDEFAQTASEFDTLAELRSSIADRLTRIARLEQASKARDAVLESVVAQLDVAVPDGILATELQNRRQQVNQQLAAAQLTLEQYLAESDGESDDPDVFWADLEERSETALKAQMLLDKVAEDRQVSIDQNDLTAHILRLAQSQGTNPQEIAEHLQEHPHHIDEYMAEIRRGKALALLVESARITDSNGEPVDVSEASSDGPATEAEAYAASSDDDDADQAADDDADQADDAEQAEGDLPTAAR